MSEKILKTDDYLKGQSDCKNGIPAKEDMSRDYYRGYNYQYECEQIQTEMSERTKKWH